MALFKRKQSKEKEMNEAVAERVTSPSGPNPANGTRMSHAPMPNGSTPPQANGRRMTSNPNPQLQPGIPNGIHSPSGYQSQPQAQQPPPPQHSQSQPQPQPSGPPNSYSSNSLNQAGLPNGSLPPNGAQSTLRPQSTAPSASASASYPWSTRPLRLFAPQSSPPTLPQSPFPRYGLSVPAFPSHSGHMLIFGGLVHENVKNDLWSMDVRDCSTMQVKTRGDAPMPRVGHACAMADRIMLVWGGDTKVKPEDAQDEGLYVLDLRTQEWTNVPVAPGPVGRYGHAVTMHDSRFFVFGGQAEGSFMNDLWAYDIKQLGVSGGQHRWEQIKFTTPPPPRRTGHVLTAHQGKLYLFGGTDGMYHYNDTWSLDIATGAWTELSCIGYIPVPREGHATAIVDDVIYIIGGRDVNGKDLGDLAAFRITNQRWYMFQNMGPAPSPRSGHAMVAAHGKVFVVGGEANASSAQSRDDPALIHILDTTKIKYPPDNAPPRQVKARGSESSQGHQTDTTATTASPPQPGFSPKQPGLGPLNSMENVATTTAAPEPQPAPAVPQQPQQVQQQPPSQPQPPPQLMAPIVSTQPMAPIVSAQPNGTAAEAPAAANGPLRAPPPQRPRREGDEEYRRALSPTNASGPSSPTHSQTNHRIPSPNLNTSSPPQPGKTGFNSSILGTRSPSPRLRTSDADKSAPPPDAFYYGKSPTVNGFNGRPTSLSSQGDLMRELRSKDMEVDAGRKREAALRVIIGRAVYQGFADDGASERNLPNGDTPNDSEVVHKLADALLRLKQEKAAIQNELVTQMHQASERAMEAERLRRGALQEAAFLRAKVATLESNSPIELARIEKERINELERQLGNLHAEHAAANRDLQKATGDSANHRDLHTAAAQRESETLRRAEDAEDAHQQAIEDMEELQHRAQSAETSLREYSERFVSLSSFAQQREAERDQLQHQLEAAVKARDQHLGVIEETQQAMDAASLRTTEMEGLHDRATERSRMLEEELGTTKAELEVHARDSELARQRLEEVEAAYAKSRQEAESFRTVTASKLGQLLESHRELRSDETRSIRGHQDQLRALEDEGNSLRKMLKEAGQRLDAAEAGVSHHRQKARDLESQHQTLRAEMRGHRTKLSSAQTELARYRDVHSSKDAELRDRDLAVTESETKCSMLRNLLSEHGIAVNDNDLANPDSASSSTSRELEAQLRERTRAHDSAQMEIEELTRRCHEAEDKVESLGRLVERMKDARSPTSMSTRSPSPPVDSDRRAVEAERKMAELEHHHKEKMAALEGDYQTAVRYVKGTEKMLKRMKDELNKQKESNKSLQSEMDHLAGRSSEPGARTRDASGRNTPSSASMESDLSRRLDKLQNQHNALQAELQASRDVLAAREREADVLRMRCEEAEREVEGLRDDLTQAQQRINTLLEMGGGGGYHLGSEDGDGLDLDRRRSAGSSEEASMAFDKFSKELKQWERSRSPQNGDLSSEEETARLNPMITAGNKANRVKGHKRDSSEYSGDWVQ